MRVFLFSVLMGAASWCSAQTFFPYGLSYRPLTNLYQPIAQLDSNSQVQLKKKWSFQSYKSVSVGMMAWKGGSASYISAPIGIQLNRRITDNVFAFAGVSVAPSFVNFRQSFMNGDLKNNGMFQSRNLGLYSRAELGIGYVNDAHTFQITGSIGIERNNYPFSSGFQPVGNSRNQTNFIRQ